MGWDIYPRDSNLNIGLIDTRGTRAGNFAAENADTVICIGSRLSMMTTGYNYDLFLRGAKKFIVVDIDEEEHKKVAQLFVSPIRANLSLDEQERAINDAVHKIKKESLDYRARNATDISDLQNIIKEQSMLQKIHITLS